MSSALTRPRRPVAGTRAWRSLGTRLALFYVVVTLGSTLAVVVLFALRADAQAAHEGQRSADSMLERYRRAFEQGGIEAVRAMTARERDGPDYALRLTDESEVELLAVASDGAAGVATPARAPRDWNVAAARVSEGRRLQIVVRNDVGKRLWAHAWEDVAMIFGLGLATAIAGAFVISRRALRPVSDLARATQRILESGDLALRVPERGADDLDELTGLFNRMLARNQALVGAMRESLDNVAHDLRTPLTRLRAGAELALSGSVTAETAREALADTIEESDRVLAMLTTLMDITEAELGAMRLHKRPEELSGIAREAVELYEHVASERGVHVVTRLSPGVEVLVDRQRVLQVAANLLDNAIKYTPAGGRAEVTVTKDERWGILAISDTGLGIPSEDRPHVWNRLFRGDRSRTERGLGLGLSLVKAVVEAHGGEVELRSEVGEGSTFEVRLPLDAPGGVARYPSAL
jgi:signal transduction histidine kinase